MRLKRTIDCSWAPPACLFQARSWEPPSPPANQKPPQPLQGIAGSAQIALSLWVPRHLVTPKACTMEDSEIEFTLVVCAWPPWDPRAWSHRPHRGGTCLLQLACLTVLLSADSLSFSKLLLPKSTRGGGGECRRPSCLQHWPSMAILSRSLFLFCFSHICLKQLPAIWFYL